MQRLFLLIIFLAVLLSSCGSQTDSDLSQSDPSQPDNSEEALDEEDNDHEDDHANDPLNEDSNNHSNDQTNKDSIQELPNQVELSYESVELTHLDQNEPTNSMELIDSLPLGDIEDEQVTLNVYQETNESHACGNAHETLSFLEVNGDVFQINECTSDRMLEDQPEEEQAVYLLDHRFNSEQHILHSAIELSANSPGRMLYLIYDTNDDKWLAFEDWGSPMIEGLAESNDILFANQFQGAHLEGPDLNFYRWNHGNLERSINISETLGIPSNLFSEIKLEGNAINALVHLESEEQLSAEYNYKQGELVKVNN
ncbi:hypothetical protein [Alkalibacillus aidingensis]|uniref:hypothetical protein n=1 Tax=Alkalibacillus aidingensis TaxID=2747607 RepID=UPI001660202D|nr:hypothetical protein [Alkalibacillus aidingensis]